MLPTISHLVAEQTKCPLVVLSTSNPDRLDAVVTQLLMTRFPVSLAVITKSQKIRTMCLYPEKKFTFNLFVIDLMSECNFVIQTKLSSMILKLTYLFLR